MTKKHKKQLKKALVEMHYKEKVPEKIRCAWAFADRGEDKDIIQLDAMMDAQVDIVDIVAKVMEW